MGDKEHTIRCFTNPHPHDPAPPLPIRPITTAFNGSLTLHTNSHTNRSRTHRAPRYRLPMCCNASAWDPGRPWGRTPPTHTRTRTRTARAHTRAREPLTSHDSHARAHAHTSGHTDTETCASAGRATARARERGDGLAGPQFGRTREKESSTLPFPRSRHAAVLHAHMSARCVASAFNRERTRCPRPHLSSAPPRTPTELRHGSVPPPSSGPEATARGRLCDEALWVCV